MTYNNELRGMWYPFRDQIYNTCMPSVRAQMSSSLYDKLHLYMLLPTRDSVFGLINHFYFSLGYYEIEE